MLPREVFSVSWAVITTPQSYWPLGYYCHLCLPAFPSVSISFLNIYSSLFLLNGSPPQSQPKQLEQFREVIESSVHYQVSDRKYLTNTFAVCDLIVTSDQKVASQKQSYGHSGIATSGPNMMKYYRTLIRFCCLRLTFQCRKVIIGLQVPPYLSKRFLLLVRTRTPDKSRRI